MIKNYCKKPVEIQAIQFDGSNSLEIYNWMSTQKPKIFEFGQAPKGVIIIPTLEGNMIANIGDYIIKGVAGEFYPCKENVFEKTYDSV